MEGVKSVVNRIHAQGLSATARKSAFSTIIGIDLRGGSGDANAIYTIVN